MNSNCLIRKFVTYINLGDAGAGPNQGGVTRTYTVGRSATAVKLLTREILSLTLDLLLYLSLTFDFLDFLPSLVLHLKSCINAGVIIIFGCVMPPVE